MGILIEEPSIDDLRCAGISSGPSDLCKYSGALSGTVLLK